MATSNHLLPDFIGIGAHKAGTTWLHENLRKHPDIWMPPKKELHYFDRAIKYPSPSQLACSRALRKRFFGSEKQNQYYRINLAKAAALNIINPSWEVFRWNLQYFFGSHDDNWYASLFESAGDKIKGEITPAYSMLDPEDIEPISQLMPDVKIIFLLRNPIDRAWSAVRYRQKRGQSGITSLSSTELAKLIDERTFELRSDYVRTLSNWRTYFPENQFFIGFYDEIQDHPKALLIRLFNFMGVDSAEHNVVDDVHRKVNASPYKAIPSELRIHLIRKYYPQIKALSSMLGSYANNWLQDAESFLNEAPLYKARVIK